MKTKVNCELDRNDGILLMKLINETKQGSIEIQEMENVINKWIQEAFEEGIRIGAFWTEK